MESMFRDTLLIIEEENEHKKLSVGFNVLNFAVMGKLRVNPFVQSKSNYYLKIKPLDVDL
ncbi:MAG: hypothetical protein M3146_06465 [Thermoproteota archaeon]|nr:hypothetical protein [Thermoproteota archaeon]